MKFHYYAFSFTWSGTPPGTTATASAYLGFPDKFVSVPRISEAKTAALAPQAAVLIGLAYMGRMTPERAKGVQQ